MLRTHRFATTDDREAIERDLLAGESYRHIATRFGTSTGALQRHGAGHLLPSVAKAHAAAEVIRAAIALGAVGTEPNVMREKRAYLELRGKISGELDKPPAQQSPFGIGPGGQMMVLTFPKTPAAEAIERERLERAGYLKPRAELPAPVADPGPVEPK